MAPSIATGLRPARLTRAALAAAALLASHGALAQVYAGVSPTGAVVLSDFRSEDAPAVLIAAPPAPAPAPSVTPGPTLAPSEVHAIVREVAAAESVPAPLLHAVIAVESAYDPRAVSPKGAQGLMQLMPDTARRFGVSDPFDPRQNVRAGARYLKDLLALFDGDLALALAAYNAGEQAVLRAGRRIPAYVETQRYVPRVLARLARAGGA